VEPKTLGWEHSKKKFENVFQKPWSSSYSTEMFSQMVLDIGRWTRRTRKWWFIKEIGDH
jgi:hypothetical protein